MNLARLIGLIGSLVGTAIPFAAVQVSSPLLGWNALGGSEPYSFFWMRPLRHYRADFYPHAMLSLTDPACWDGTGSRLLVTYSFPEDRAGWPYDGLVACVNTAPDGRVTRVQIMDGDGTVLTRPRLARHIISNWRFEARPLREGENSWQPIRLDGLLAHEAPLKL